MKPSAVVLVVEDEVDTGELLAEHLRRRGFHPTLITLGTEAIKYARENIPDLMILDLMLPDVDGFTVCETLKLDRETNLIPIIMMTGAFHEHQHEVRGWQVGANYYLNKPFTLDQMNEAIAYAVMWREERERHGTDGEIHFEFQSDIQYLEDLNDLLSALFLHTPLNKTQVQQLIIALREIGTNAIEWGHRKELERVVSMTYQIDKDRVVLIVRDSGPGFDPGQLPHAASDADPTGHLMVREALGIREGGFGLMMVRGLVDDLTFNERGNEVRLVKNFNSTVQPLETST